MVEYFSGSIFDAPIDILIHGCNCQGGDGKFGPWGGLAGQVKKLYPEAHKKDSNTKLADPAKLGTYSSVRVTSQPNARISFVVNSYTQFNISGTKRETSYDAVVSVLTLLRDNLVKKGLQHMTIGIPYKYGCGLGGAEWPIVEAIIRHVFEGSSFKVLICQRTEDV